MSFIVNSPTHSAIVPPGSLGTVDVTVTTLAGTSPITVNDQYTYQNPGPTVTNVNPSLALPQVVIRLRLQEQILSM